MKTSPASMMEEKTEGRIRIGVIWGDEDCLVFWEGNENPVPNDIVQFVKRHPEVADELLSRGLTPEGFAADEKPIVFVLMPEDWMLVCPVASVNALINRAEDVNGGDVLMAGWQANDRMVLEIVMKERVGARRLLSWITKQRMDGVWKVFAEYCS